MFEKPDPISQTSFTHPRQIFRPAPFWSLNDALDPEECARQMNGLLDVGYAGGYFHARQGLASEYLGSEWFAGFRAALQAAKERGGLLWLYDEDLWPSGNAGGAVAAAKPEYRMLNLVPHLLFPGETPPAETPERTFHRAYQLHRSGLTLHQADPLTSQEAAERLDQERLVFTCEVGPGQARWGGLPEPNRLNPAATQEFIRLTHERYAQEVGESFGHTIPGVFSDEPDIPNDGYSLPWYDQMPQLYQTWHGRDFWADLPYLFFDGPQSRKIRLFILRTIHRQFVEAFSKPIYEWCAKHRLAFTGHYMHEDFLLDQIKSNCGGVMAHYRYEQIPGVDHLFCDNNKPFLTLRQVTSAARQLGRKYALCEIFGGSRHSCTFADLVWMAHLNLVMGINLLCPHLAWYSLTGVRKRDWPQTMSYQQTYWPDLPLLNDYFARLSSILSTGRPVVDVLMLHPMESALASHRFGLHTTRKGFESDHHKEIHDLDRLFRRALEAVMHAGYDCDLGDEGYLADLGRVENGCLRVGEMAYRMVIVPQARTWRPGTYALLRQFAQAGGKIIFLGELPSELDAEPTQDQWPQLAKLAETLPSSGVQLQTALDRLVQPSFRLRSEDGRVVPDTLVQHRTDGERHLYFIVNNSLTDTRTYALTFLADVPHNLTRWDALTTRKTRMTLNGNCCRLTLSPGSAILLVSGPGADQGAADPAPLPNFTQADIQPLPVEWRFTRSEENTLVMDRFSVSTDDGTSWSNEEPDYVIRKKVQKWAGLSAYDRWQPWQIIRKGAYQGKNLPLRLRYRFTNTLTRPTPIAFVFERLARADRLWVNGQAVEIKNCGWQWDRQLGKVDISAWVRPGENVVEVRLILDALTEIEPAYLAGDFGVQITACHLYGELIAEPDRLHNGSWTQQGYPFYSGRMTYRTTVQSETGRRSFLRLPGVSAVLCHIRVNGKQAGAIFQPPYLLELTDFLNPGQNTLEIEVVSSRQNLFGPLHDKLGEDNHVCGAFCFQEPWFMREGIGLQDYGLLQGAEILRT